MNENENLYEERPILFSAGMVRAILDGKKTQTRRIVNPQPEAGKPWKKYWVNDPDGIDLPVGLCPYGVKGDRLYVREKFGYVWPDDCDDGRIYDKDHYEFGRPIENDEMNVVYYATDPDFVWFDEDAEDQMTTRFWKPAIHMPKKRARLWLNITSVRLERLQGISAADATAEGFASMFPVLSFREYWERAHADKRPQRDRIDEWSKGWSANPWVWVIDFFPSMVVDTTKKLWRALIRVEGSSDDGVLMTIPAWNPNQKIFVPVADLPEAVLDAARNGRRRVHARVNIGAGKSEDIIIKGET